MQALAAEFSGWRPLLVERRTQSAPLSIKPKFRNLGIVLVLVVVLVLGALAFCAGKHPFCPAIILFR